MKPIVLASLSLLLACTAPVHAKTGIEFLQEAQPPAFKDGHTLLPLTRWMWPLSFEMNVELAQRWGYAVDIDIGSVAAELDDPKSDAARAVAFLQASSGRYPSYVYTRRVMFEYDKIAGLLSPGAWVRNPDGSLILDNGRPVMKPYISNNDAKVIGESELTRLRQLKDRGIDVTIVLNGAEYQPSVRGHDLKFWELDPEVKSWLTSVDALPPSQRVDAYASEKAKQEQAVRDAVLSVMPDSEVVYYMTGDVRRGIVPEDIRLPWVYPYRHLIKGSTIPSWEYYFGYFGNWVRPDAQKDYLVNHATNGAAQAIEAAAPLTYNWLSAGWSLTTPSLVSDDKRYMGFLKFLYTLGSIGNVAGYFTYPAEGFNGDVGSSPPDWLRQIMLLSHAHATFTHLETYLRNGDLLPGDRDHDYAKDLYGRPSWPHPAYEFVTREDSLYMRVAARKLRDKNDWLVVAWATNGVEQDVNVTIPELGNVTLRARPEGSLYRATPGPTLKLLDPIGMDPSRRIAAILSEIDKPSPPQNLTIE